MSDPNELNEQQIDLNIEDELDAALAALGSDPLPTTTLPEQAAGEPSPPAPMPTASPTLDGSVAKIGGSQR